jgi:hypothetical protein
MLNQIHVKKKYVPLFRVFDLAQISLHFFPRGGYNVSPSGRDGKEEYPSLPVREETQGGVRMMG